MNKLVENYLLQESVGKGVYGQVFRAIHQKSKEEYAVKVIPKSAFRANPKLEQLAINQINILSSLKNEHIVRFVETLKTPNNFYFVYEYCNEGTIESYVKKNKFLKENEALKIFRQLLEAFKELNKNNIMHRDLKPDNIFLNDGKVKLGDFGFCKMLEVNMAQTMLGSPIYMAPEVLKQEIYTSKADIWSLGVVLFQMLFGYCPFESSSISQLINMLKQTDLVIPKDINPISEETQLLIEKMLVKDQFKRIEWVDLFDFKIDDEGKILEGYNKTIGIQILQKYFIYEMSGKSDTNSEKNSKKAIKSQDNIEDLRVGQKKEGEFTSQQQISVDPKKEQPPKYSSQRQLPPQKIKTTKAPSPILKNDILSEIASPLPITLKKHAQSSPPSEEPNKRYTQKFITKHKQWMEGIDLMQELSMNPDRNDEVCIFWLMTAILSKVEPEFGRYPEWIDVLLEEKKCLEEALAAMKKADESLAGMTMPSAKNQLLKLWKKKDLKNQALFQRMVRYIYSKPSTTNNIEEILQY